MKLAAFLLGLVQPMLGRILVALGFQVVTIVGFEAGIGAVKNIFLAQMMAVPTAGFQLAMLAGCGIGFGMIFGAITFRLALWAIQNTTRILGVNT
jgi:Protein of unknown function (DUF2523)